MDLRDIEHNTRDGVHIASLAGAWTAAVAGFGGMRDQDGALAFAPRLPPRLERLVFRLLFRGRRLRVEVSRFEASYTLVTGESLEVTHYGMPITLVEGEQVTEPIPPGIDRPAPSQPPGREPARRAPDGTQ